MPYKMNEAQFDAVVALPAQERYDHFISKVADWEELWTLRDETGFVLFQDDAGSECIPVWPHPDYAAALARGRWEECTPARLDLESFTTEWIPGAAEEGRVFAAFPTPDKRGPIVSPGRLRDDLETESERYE